MENMEEKRNQTLPMIALRGLVMFPNMIFNFDVGRAQTLAAIEEAMKGNQLIFMAAQKNEASEEINVDNISQVGVVARIQQVVKGKRENAKIVAEGLYRAFAVGMQEHSTYFSATVIDYPLGTEPTLSPVAKEAYLRNIKTLFGELLGLLPRMPKEFVNTIYSAQDPLYAAEYIASNLLMRNSDKQAFLEESNPIKRLQLIVRLLEQECEVVAMELDINERVQQQLDRNRREYFLREQLHQIQNELGITEEDEEENGQYVDKIRALKLGEDFEKKLLKEAKRLAKLPDASQEAAVIRTYLDTCLDLPWNTSTKDTYDIKKAKTILDKDHYGLEKVKDRILEFLAIKQLNAESSAQIICLVGPPGVGKTSIARSVARALHKKYVRIALGGIHDESEIRGHRRTYVGSMPGRIMQAVKQAKCNNPLILLDEIDKLGKDIHGDPASALLEALDPEQNSTFTDHYIDMPFDLSKVLFITTANDVSSIPGPLYDRMDVIQLSSYTREEKLKIAKKHLVSKQIKRNGLNSKQIRITDSALYSLIDHYTREAGVRSLERKIADLCRKTARGILSEEFERQTITDKNIAALLGAERFQTDRIEDEDQVGVVTGLAWTSVGGETMQIEVAALEGTGKLELTGSLGDVMKESAKAAITCVRTLAREYGIAPDFYKTVDLHIHVPEGAVPKDGPSAGIAMTTAIVSALSGIPVRRDVAMTGEITLRGRVLPIGGLKEKTIAAYRCGVKTVIIPDQNQKDLEEVAPIVKENVTFCVAKEIRQVLEIALIKPAVAAKTGKKSFELNHSEAAILQ